MYHLELRQFPHNLCRFNLTEDDLRATVLEPWMSDRWIELEGRKWSPHQATLTVLEGPRIPLGQLTMGRGWRTAQRKSRDVTEALLGAARGELAEAVDASGVGAGAVEGQGGGESPGAGTVEDPGAGVALGAGAAVGMEPAPVRGVRNGEEAQSERGTSSREAALADSLGLELLSQIGMERAPLRHAWELAGARHSRGSASDSLAIAERAIGTLLRSGLVVLLVLDVPDGDPRPLDREDAERALAAIESWTGEGRSARIWIRRA